MYAVPAEARGYASTIESGGHADSAGAARYALMASKSTTAVNAEAVVFANTIDTDTHVVNAEAVGYVSTTTCDTRVGSVSAMDCATTIEINEHADFARAARYASTTTSSTLVGTVIDRSAFEIYHVRTRFALEEVAPQHSDSEVLSRFFFHHTFQISPSLLSKTSPPPSHSLYRTNKQSSIQEH